MYTKKLKGNALIEFALVLPILLALVFGIVEFGSLFYDKAIITNASREGARYGVSLRTPYATTAQIIAYTTAYTTDKLLTFSSTPTAPVVTATPSAASPAHGDTLKVQVTYVYTSLVLFKLLGLGGEITLSASTDMTYE